MVILFRSWTGYTITENAALGHLAYQSSEHGIPGPASKAVDGNLSPDRALNRSCSCTSSEVNPWWVVDLGRPRDVVRVDIINRIDNCGTMHILLLDIHLIFFSRVVLGGNRVTILCYKLLKSIVSKGVHRRRAWFKFISFFSRLSSWFQRRCEPHSSGWCSPCPWKLPSVQPLHRHCRRNVEHYLWH